MFCKNCGCEINENQKFCPKCGNPIEIEILDNKRAQSKDVKSKTKKIVSLLLAIVLIIGVGSYVGINVYKNGKYLSKSISTTTSNTLSSTITTTFIYREDGLRSKSTTNHTYDGTDNLTINDYTYDSFGKLVKEDEKYDDGDVKSLNITYSETDNQYIGNGNYSDGSGSVELIYDKNNKLISRAEYGSEQILSKEFYNKDGQTIEQIFYLDGEETSKILYEYDKYGNQIKYSEYSSGILSYVWEQSYSKGNPSNLNKSIEAVIKISNYDENGELESVETVNYERTKTSSNICETIYLNEDSSNSLPKKIITTFDNCLSQNVLKTELTYKSANIVTTENEYEWRDFSRLSTWKEVLF